MSQTIHTWYVRAKCDCGYIWTNSPNDGIICDCGASQISGGQLIGNAQPVTDEVEFKQAVANYLNEDVSNVVLEQGT